MPEHWGRRQGFLLYNKESDVCSLLHTTLLAETDGRMGKLVLPKDISTLHRPKATPEKNGKAATLSARGGLEVRSGSSLCTSPQRSKSFPLAKVAVNRAAAVVSQVREKCEFKHFRDLDFCIVCVSVCDGNSRMKVSQLNNQFAQCRSRKAVSPMKPY